MSITHLADDLTPTETNLAKALALIQKALPRLDDSARKSEVQSILGRAIALIDAARAAHGGATNAVGSHSVATTVPPHIAAVIAAAVSVVLDRPYLLVSVQQVTAPIVPNLNAWAVEGRTQIFMSHKVR